MGAGESPPISPHLEEAKDRCRPLLKRQAGTLVLQQSTHLAEPGKRNMFAPKPLGWTHSTLEKDPSADL